MAMGGAYKSVETAWLRVLSYSGAACMHAIAVHNGTKVACLLNTLFFALATEWEELGLLPQYTPKLSESRRSR